MRAKVRSIIDHGINCFINRQLIYNLPEEMFADAGGWMSVGRVPGCVQAKACWLSCVLEGPFHIHWPYPPACSNPFTWYA